MSNEPPKVFLDTNVWFSALYGSPNCEALITLHLQEKIIAVVSQQVLEECIRNIQEKIPAALPAFQKLIKSHPPLVIANPSYIDPKIKKLVRAYDQSIFASAIMGTVNYFVTGNTKDFSVTKLEKLTGIKILTPKEAVKIFF